MLRIGINGLGRIGRCLFRVLFENNIPNVELVAVNGSSSLELHRHLLRNDSVHGRFGCDIGIKEGALLEVGGKTVKFFKEKQPQDIPWEEVGVNVVLECTGKFNNRESSGLHLGGTVKKVVVSAPVADADIQVIFGVNEGAISSEHDVISVGSCTTNCAAHVVKAMDEAFGIEGGFITTVHAYTNDQNHVDGSHKDLRRARACGLSMIPTTTGASKALEVLFPKLSGKLSASSIRVPTPNVSVVDFAFVSSSKATVTSINEALCKAATARPDVLMASDEQLVSSDFNHTTYSAVFDLMETYANDGGVSRVLAWYDNEWAFATRMVDVSRELLRFL
ncbi:type I glyceraldehyde-3-phosphate dehydrogenase [Anaplasma marginale]|uniref:type I glyceraldehyde-3-phosphate dehydrogenase n=1 Tax=Anaplasma marginale TaxID=770 RepID=UPI0001B46581|nr:type I glyceraldehyde-3-phosphate dehydrogenase [Anaplasma marginale]AXW84451.1 type I glyceraldehyde-3-phosphate dehydrogenase [Anaplasma marginale]AXW85385.1 type I glyceraldehyde-3-phosphate dehydrogenase [Anaplasma marginale]KAB0453110.1 type I glyceraldehyde-3-phosphate dehydrogenase [Anaplasma marginale]